MFEINTGLVFWTTLSFIVLLALLYKIVFPPLNRVLELRRKTIEGKIEEAKKVQLEAEGMLAKYSSQMNEAEKKTGAMFEDAREQAQSFREESIKNAQKESRQIIEKTKEDINMLKQKALRGLKEDIAGMVVDINRRLIQKQLKNEDHLKLVEASIEELEKNAKRKV